MIYRLYVGADNTTGEVNIEGIKTVIGEHFHGYAILEAKGVWKGKDEKSVIVEIAEDNEDADGSRLSLLEKMTLDMKAICKQDIILLARVSSSISFI